MPQCIESVLRQSYRDLDIIIVDDGSTDGSSQICDDFAKIDKRIRVIHQKNKGISGTRNVGLELIKGEYICFIDSDDWVGENYILDFVNNANKDRIVCCGYNTFSRGDIRKYYLKQNDVLSSNDFIKVFIDDCVNCVVLGKKELVGNYLWNKLWPRDSFASVRFPEGDNYEDMYVFIDLVRSVKEVKLLPECNYSYRIRDNSIVSSTNKRNMLDVVKSRLKQEHDLLNDTILNFKAKLLTLSSICWLFASFYKGNYNLNEEEKEYYKKLISERIESIPRFKYNKLYLKCFLILHLSSLFELIYKVKRLK